MGFYGNTTDTSKTHFQFDKIFSSRTEMDRACAEGIDEVYTGRFVLVKYDQGAYYPGHILYGYVDPEEPDIIYVDALCTKPYMFVTYIPVIDPRQEDWESYYELSADERFYIKLTSQNQFNVNKTYYTHSLKNVDNSLRDDVVSENAIVFKKDITTKVTDGKFYKCIGEDDLHTGKAKWELINAFEDDSIGSYLLNFHLDFTTYGDLFDYRGYDATVWEKTYNEGKGKFIYIANLNAHIPNFEIYGDPPSELPTIAYIDSMSSNDVYRIKVPNFWGFQIKEAEENSPSDQIISQKYYKYDINNKIETDVKENVRADIYFNLNKEEDGQVFSHKNYKLRDDNTKDEIIIAPTGKSGKKYYNTNGDFVEQEDTQELSIHLPIVGNMISDGYDLIYGENELDEETGLITRPTDTEWYDGNDSDELKNKGNALLGGKTHKLNTLAGTINTIHDLMGQIIVNLNSFPTSEDIQNLSPNLIYKIGDNLYRKGTTIISSIIPDSEYSFTRKRISEDEFRQNKYYTLENGNFIPVEGAFNSDIEADPGYYLRNINSIRYTPVELESFISGQYYWKDGSNYYCDNSNYIPRYLNRTYYKNIQATEKSFSINYVNDGSFFINEDDIFKPVFDIIPSSLQDKYYTIARTGLYNGASVLYYYPNCYYYKDPVENSWHLATEETYNPNYQYFAFTFSEEPSYGLDENNNVIKYYSVISRQEVSFSTPPDNLNLSEIYIFYENQYIPYTKLGTLDFINGKDPHVIPWKMYTLNYTEFSSDEIYFSGIYHEKTGDNSYILSYNFNNDPSQKYYLITSVDTVEHPFYVPERYWYEESENYYVLDRTLQKTNNRQYYIKASLYVYYDEAQECPIGYEWNDYSAYIPPSIQLCFHQDEVTLIRLAEFDEVTDTLYGLLLKLNTLYDNNNDTNRDTNTFKGLYNNLKDSLYQLKKLKPGEILYANDFGQIESMSLSKLKQLLNNI